MGENTRSIAAALSVRDLVRRRLGLDDDVWNLALVQRDEVWDQTRMRHLLDSLLRGYPIGSILVCRVAEPSAVLGAGREARAANPDDWQLLDGQQRINALVSLFSEAGRYGRFYLNMAMPLSQSGPMQRRRSKDRALQAIAWQHDDDVAGSDASIEDRHVHVDLSRWSTWAEERIGAGLGLPAQSISETLHSLDPSFSGELGGAAADTARARLETLWSVWTQPTIPVLTAELTSPLDVLEVFTRVNLGGVQIAGTDVFFAAVKTFWNDAEAHMERVRQSASLLRSRTAALRFLSRLASHGAGQGDLLPLAVERLSGERGASLIAAMTTLATEDSETLFRMRRFDHWFERATELGLALEMVPNALFDDVLGWVAASPRADEAWWRENRAAIDGYLIAASVLRYRDALGDRFHREAFREALASGAAGERFPVERITAVARAAGLRGVPGLDDPDGVHWVTQRSGRLLTTLAQRLPLASPPIDWDHIFPQAQSRRMRVRSPEGSRRRWAHHPKRRIIHEAGNLWALPQSTNRALGKLGPAEKFTRLTAWLDSGTGHPVLPRDHWSLLEAEIAEFAAIDATLPSSNGGEDDAAASDAVMDRFEHLVQARTARLLREAIERFPEIASFASDSDIAPSDRSETPDLGEALGIARRDEVSAGDQRERDAAVRWEPRRAEFERTVDRVSHHLRRGRRTARVTDPPEYEFSRSIRVARPHPETHIAFGFTYRMHTASGSPFWVAVDSRVGDWPLQSSRLELSGILDDAVREVAPTEDGDVSRLWIPLEVDYALQGVPLRVELLAAARRIVDAMDGA